MQHEQIQWPVVKVGGKTRVLRWTPEAYSTLLRWGCNVTDDNQIRLITYATASLGFERWHDLTDCLLPGEAELLAPATQRMLDLARLAQKQVTEQAERDFNIRKVN